VKRAVGGLPGTWVLSVAYVAMVPLAAALVKYVGTVPPGGHTRVVPVWPGVFAPAAVYVVGVTLVLRDVVQERIGFAWTLVLVGVGAALAAAVSPSLAVASAVAYLTSETVDAVVFTLARPWPIVAASATSAVFSVPVDSVVFLQLAFGSLMFLDGQIIGKTIGTLAGLAGLWWVRRRR
jgi:queuosine precursor transporter